MKDAQRELCLIHANCQGEPLAALLALSPQFAARWQTCHITNYTREELPSEQLHRCTLFLYQHLGPHWGDLASEAVLARLGPKAQAVCIPNMFFQGYWPFWTSSSPMNFGDFLLDKLFESGADKPEILRIYLHGKLDRFVDMDAVARASLEREVAKEECCAVKTAAFVAANWKKIPLFQTVNHPDIPLLRYMVDGLLAHLGLPPLPEVAANAFSFDYEGFSLPIHPGVAAYHALPFANADTVYPVFGRGMTFAQYISRYIECRRNGLEDSFLGFLQLV